MEYLATVPCITIETINHIKEYNSSFSTNMAKTSLRRAVKMLLEGRPLMAPPYLSDQYRPFNNLEQLMLNDQSHVNYHIMEAIRQMIRETSAPRYMLSEEEVFFLFNRAYAIVAHAMKNTHPELHLQKYIFADDAQCSTQSEVDLLLFRLKLPMAYCILKSIRYHIGGGALGKYDRLFVDMEKFLDNELPRRFFQLMNIGTEVWHENENENSIEYWKRQRDREDDLEVSREEGQEAPHAGEPDADSAESSEITEGTNIPKAEEKRRRGKPTDHLFVEKETPGLSVIFAKHISDVLPGASFAQSQERKKLYKELYKFADEHRDQLFVVSKAAIIRFLTGECNLLKGDGNGKNNKNFENQVENLAAEIKKLIVRKNKQYSLPSQ